MIESKWEYSHLYEMGNLYLNNDELELLADQVIAIGFQHHHPKELCPVFTAIIKMAIEAGIMDEKADNGLVKEFLDDMDNYRNPKTDI